MLTLTKVLLLEINILLLACHARYAASLSVNPSINGDVITLPSNGDSANDVLCRLLHDTRNNNNDDDTKQEEPTTLVRLDGFVSKRRAIGKSLVFLDVVPSELPTTITTITKATTTTTAGSSEEFACTNKPVQALLRRDVWNRAATNDDDNKSQYYDLYRKILQPGAYCRLYGEAGPSRLPNEALVFCTSARYTLPNDNLQHLRNAIRFARDGVLDCTELCEALACCLDEDEITQMLRGRITDGECAADILSRFPRNLLRNPSQLMGNSNSAKVALLPPVPEEYTPRQYLLEDRSSRSEPSTIPIRQWSDTLHFRDGYRIEDGFEIPCPFWNWSRAIHHRPRRRRRK